MPKKHPTHVEGFAGDIAALARAIAAMRYDVIAELLGCLSTEFEQQAVADQGRGRTKLASLLQTFNQRLRDDQAAMQKIFRLCAPHMTDELARHEST